MGRLSDFIFGDRWNVSHMEYPQSYTFNTSKGCNGLELRFCFVAQNIFEEDK